MGRGDDDRNPRFGDGLRDDLHVHAHVGQGLEDAGRRPRLSDHRGARDRHQHRPAQPQDGAHRLAVGLPVGDQGAGTIGMKGVPHPDRDPILRSRLQRTRMHRFRAELPHLDRLGKRDVAEQARLRHDARIGTHQSVHVAPDPHFVGWEARSDQRRRQVRSAAPERGDRAVLCAGNEARDDDRLAVLQPRLQRLSNLVQRELHERNGLGVAVVGHDSGLVAGHSVALERGRHDHRRQPLPE